MVTVQGVFLDNVGASEALLQLLEHMKLNPLMLVGQPHARNQNQGTLPCGRLEELNILRLLHWKLYYSLWMDLLAGDQL